MSLKHAILGFLSFSPFTGYDLKKAFDQSVAHFWPANQSQIYRTLAELDTEGLVTKEVIAREERLDMKRYQITEGGRQALRQWLSTPHPPADTREPFLVQVYFGGHLTDAELLPVLQHNLQAAEEQLAGFTALYQSQAGRPNPLADQRAVFLALLTLEYGLTSLRAYRDWLAAAITRVQAHDYRPLDLTGPVNGHR